MKRIFKTFPYMACFKFYYNDRIRIGVGFHRKKEKERSLNIVTRDRMGFNDESFIGEPYHGRKGKK